MRTASKMMKRWKFAIATLILASCVVSLSISQTADAAIRPPSGWPKSFTLLYCWGASNTNDVGSWCPCADITLNRDRTIDVLDCISNTFYPNAGMWRKRQRWGKLNFTLSNGAIYEGVQLPDGSYEGTMVTPSGITGVWVGEFNP